LGELVTADPPGGVPPAEVSIDESVVRQLLREQHPDLAKLPIRLAATGWDNMTYRLGDALAVRLPRIRGAVDLLRHEQTWLPWIAESLRDVPLTIPVPQRVGQPGKHFPWPWSVVPWVPGRCADHQALPASDAVVFGRFLASLHVPAPELFPRNGYRGVALRTQAATVAAGLRAQVIPTAAGGQEARPDVLSRIWQRALRAPIDTPEVRLHGDLHPRNLVVGDGRLAAVIDWGDMTVGDPATDLAAAWMLFPPSAHEQVLREYGGISDHTRARARGWALFFGFSLLRSGATGDPAFTSIGRATLSRLSATE
jgi:aminoglycoside phosphotransferase (APT) family kinase protein